MSQPVEEYPNTVMTQQPDPNSSRSNGSFGPVFAVLAVIVVISAVACVLGRLCSKRRHRAKEAAAHHPPKAGKQGQQQGLPKEWQKPSFMKDGDIELGFGKKAPPAKVAAKSGGGKTKPPRQPEFRFSDN